MDSRHLLDTELLPMLDMPSVGNITKETLAAARLSYSDKALAFPVPSEPRVSFNEQWVPAQGRAPDVRVLVYRPIGADKPVAAILHIHGGGYILGTADMFRASNQMLAAELGCVVVSVDYRLAPDTPYPGPVEDCYAALLWLYRHADEIGVDPQRIGISGESAGGGLAAGLALLARDRGEISLVFQHLIYPMIDDRTVISNDPHPYAGEFLWTPDLNRFGWQSMLGDMAVGAPEVPPYAAAARASDLAGLPPTFIAVGALDLFLEENLDYARRLTRSGVPVELHVYPGAPHGFHWIVGAKVTMNAERDSLEALRRLTGSDQADK